MAVTEIIQFDAAALLNAQAPRTFVDDTVQKAVNALKGVKLPQHFVLGTQVQGQAAVQIMSEWDGVHDDVNFATTPEFRSLVKSMRTYWGEPHNIFQVTLNRSAFGPDGPAAANVVEFVQSYFPASRVTPEFQKQIEDDFLKFDEIYTKGVTGNSSWALGWIMEEQDHESIEGGKAKCFFIARGWESMEHFEKSVKNDAYKKAIPLLFAWNAPFKMWHVERKIQNGFQVVQ